MHLSFDRALAESKESGQTVKVIVPIARSFLFIFNNCKNAAGTIPWMVEVKSCQEQRSKALKAGALGGAGEVADTLRLVSGQGYR